MAKAARGRHQHEDDELEALAADALDELRPDAKTDGIGEEREKDRPRPDPGLRSGRRPTGRRAGDEASATSSEPAVDPTEKKPSDTRPSR